MNERSRSTLFLMEQLIVILVFAICAAGCLEIFVGSYVMARESRDTRNSLLLAQSAAECFKASGGELGETASYIGGKESAGILTVYYDKGLDECGESEAAYVLNVARREKEFLVEGDITVSKPGGALIFALTAASRR